MAATKKTTAFERFAISQVAIATAMAEVDAPELVVNAKADLMKLFRDNGIEARFFTAPKGEAEKSDNEWIAARHWLFHLAAFTVKIAGIRLSVEGVAQVFDDSLTNAALICGQKKGDWKNRMNNQVGDKWGKKVFGEAVKAEAKAAEAAQAAQAAPAPEPTAQEREAALTKENQEWFGSKLNELFRRTHKEAGAFIAGDIAAVQDLIRSLAKEVGGVTLHAPK